jgi:hypothetical protein
VWPDGRSSFKVHGRAAKLHVNGSENPSLVVNGLKGEDLQGSVALWGYSGEEAYFSNLKVIPAKAEAVTNDGEASGTWEVKFASDYGRYEGSMNLHRDGNVVKGTWSPVAMAKDRPSAHVYLNLDESPCAVASHDYLPDRVLSLGVALLRWPGFAHLWAVLRCSSPNAAGRHSATASRCSLARFGP